MSEERVSLSPQSTTAGPGPGEVGYVPPTDAVGLPSLGKVYPVDSPLHGARLVEIRSMTARDEDILSSAGLLKQGKAISALLKSCIVDRTIDPDQLIIGDRNAILIAIRITGYGAEYKISVDCPACGQGVDHTFDLAQLPIKNLGADPVAPGTNAFPFTLPVSKKEVTFKLLTGADDRELSVTLDRMRKIAGPGNTEPGVTQRLLHSIISFNKETDRTKLSRLVPNLPARDAREFRQRIEEVMPGVEMRQTFHCPACGDESEVDVPMGTEFFWPR